MATLRRREAEVHWCAFLDTPIVTQMPVELLELGHRAWFALETSRRVARP